MVRAPVTNSGIWTHNTDREPQWRSSIRLANVRAHVAYDDEEVEEEEEEDDDHEPIWYKDSDHQPGCPCCIEGTGFPRPPSSALSSSDYGAALRKASRASTHISTNSVDSETSHGLGEKDTNKSNTTCDTNVRLRRSVSTFGLKMKKSMKNLNRRPSGSLR